MRKLLISGLDPGTTAGWAAIDKEGNLISAGSKKGISPDELTAILRELGKVIIIGTDKAKIPSLSRTIGARFKAKIIKPPQDLSKEEKKELAKKEFYSNDHEMDAIASAKYAYKQYLPLLKKIRKYSTRNKQQKIEDKIIQKVIRTECSISQAAQEIEEKTQCSEKRTKGGKEGKEEKQKKQKQEHIREKTSIETILKKENKALRIFIKNQENKINKLIQKLKKKDKKTKEEKQEKKTRAEQEKKILIKNLRKELERQKKKTNKIIQEKENILKNLKNMEDKIIIKKIKNIGMKAINKIKDELKNNDILYVSDPNSFSKKAVESLRKKDINILITEKKATNKVQKIMPFIFIPKKEVKISTIDSIAFLSKKSLEKNKKLLVKKILENYREERKL